MGKEVGEIVFEIADVPPDVGEVVFEIEGTVFEVIEIAVEFVNGKPGISAKMKAELVSTVTNVFNSIPTQRFPILSKHYRYLYRYSLY